MFLALVAAPLWRSVSGKRVILRACHRQRLKLLNDLQFGLNTTGAAL